MTQGTEWKVILLFTLPIMAGNFLQQLYSTVDSIVVGQFVGESALSAVGTCTPMVMLFLALSNGLGIGISVVVSQFFGAGQLEEMARAITTAIRLMALVGIVLTGIAQLVTPFLLSVVLGVQNPVILEMAILYFRIYAGGLLFPVSYTHLDVYKRQAAGRLFCRRQAVCPFGRDRREPEQSGWKGSALCHCPPGCTSDGLRRSGDRSPGCRGTGLPARGGWCPSAYGNRLGLYRAWETEAGSAGNRGMQRSGTGGGAVRILCAKAGTPGPKSDVGKIRLDFS